MADSGRIAINAAIIGERPTGLGIYALEIIRALDALGEQLLVYTSRPDLIAGRHTRVEAISSRMRPERGAGGCHVVLHDPELLADLLAAGRGDRDDDLLDMVLPNETRDLLASPEYLQPVDALPRLAGVVIEEADGPVVLGVFSAVHFAGDHLARVASAVDQNASRAVLLP